MFSNGQKGPSLKFGWFDPHLNLLATNNLNLNETSGVESVVPKLTYPLRPGVWTAVGMKQNELFYKEKFLILPNDEEAPSYQHTVIKDPSLERFVGPADRIEGDPTSLISQFFLVEEKCAVDDVVSSLPSCHLTSWSSFFPDRKSQILGINPETGFILEN